MNPVVPPPLIGALIALAMWMSAKATPDLDFEIGAATPVAVAIAAAGFAIDLAAVVAFFRRRTTVNPLTPGRAQRLVTDGLYRFSRNPMYLGMALMLAGLALWLGHVFAFAGPVLFVQLINEMQIKPEERALEDKFGDDYREYRNRVRRWI